jgi:hypothetical protein
MDKNKLIIFLISVIAILLITNIIYLNKYNFQKNQTNIQKELFQKRKDSLNIIIRVPLIDSMNVVIMKNNDNLKPQVKKQKTIKSKPKSKKDISLYEGFKNLMLELNGSHK